MPPVSESSPLFSIRAGNRTFSFGSKPGRLPTPPKSQQTQQPPPPPPQAQQPAQQSTPASPRDRATTVSSVSTATPPRLDTSLSLGVDADDGFSNMFDNIGKRRSMAALQQQSQPVRTSNGTMNGYTSNGVSVQDNGHANTAAGAPPSAPAQADRPPLSISSNVDHAIDAVASPTSAVSPTSPDGLFQSPAEDSERGFSVNRKPQAPSQSRPASSAQDSSPPSPGLARRKRASTDRGIRRVSVVEDIDAKIVRESFVNSRRNTQPAVTENNQDHEDDEDTPLFKKSPTENKKEDKTDDFFSAAQLASRYEASLANNPPSNNNKVMTPAQFERYREQKELSRQLRKAEGLNDSSDEDSNYEDDEEIEMKEAAARQRRKQEAHLAVYRQQMKKVIGKQDDPPPFQRPESPRVLGHEARSSSASNLAPRLSTLGLSDDKPDAGKSSDDDEDIPLGILAAHGFPNKNRPPTRLAMSNSNPNLRSSFMSSSASIAGDGPGSRGSLPVFARNLPKDPYIGASLVNQPNRESLAMGGGTPPGLPPGGLVGVIANEERARAMRRGSPNPPGGAMSGIPRPYSMAANMAMDRSSPGPSPMWNNVSGGFGQPVQQMSPGEQAQLQISQQMAEIMQTQVQMMQQMMQMQGMVPMQQPPQSQTPGAFSQAPQNPSLNVRPMSMASSFHLPQFAPQSDQRTFSMLDPGLSRWNANNNNNRASSFFPDPNNRPGTPRGGPAYAPSIAPSERSNVGLAPRYRPVSGVGAGADPNRARRSSTFTASTRPWNDENQRPSSFLAQPQTSRPSERKSTLLSNVTGPQSSSGAASDDDDEEGWASLVKKREKKKKGGKKEKKEGSALDGLWPVVD